MTTHVLTTTDKDGALWYLTAKMSLASSPAYATKGSAEAMAKLIPAAAHAWRGWDYAWAVRPLKGDSKPMPAQRAVP